MFNLRNDLKNALQEAVDEAMVALNSNIVFGHIFWGKLSDEGSVRISYIKVSDDVQKAGAFAGMNTEAAFTRHIRRVGREKTFADFLYLLFYKDKVVDESRTSFICQITNELHRPFVYSKTENIHKLVISTKFAEILLPVELATNYVDLFLSGNDDLEKRKEYIAGEFGSRRHIALAFLHDSDEETVADLQTISAPYDSDEYGSLDFLGAFQTALIYRATCPEDSEVGFISQSRGIASLSTTDNSTDYPTVLVSSIYHTSEEEQVILEIQAVAADKIAKATKTAADTHVESVKYFGEELEKSLPALHTNARFIKRIDEIINQEMGFKFQPGWAPSLAVWNSYLIEALRNSVHEGRYLTFSFVMADVSEIRDSSLFELHGLRFDPNEEERDVFHPWKKGTDNKIVPVADQVDQILKLARKAIEKKNYSWFADGKYALLWDAAFPSSYPHSLVRVKDSSWDVVINDIRNNRGSRFAEVAPMIIAFARNDRSGGLIINNKLVASYRKSESWKYEGSEEREFELRKALTQACARWKLPCDDVQELMMKALLAISDDPNSGCMLIMGKNIGPLKARDMKPMFPSMGAPFKTRSSTLNSDTINPVSLTIDELTSLMAMDGATCIFAYNKLPAITFRNSVMLSRGKRDVSAIANELDGEGSRKWSAVNAASQLEVDIVIAVSQDGPIYVFEPDETDKALKVPRIL